MVYGRLKSYIVVVLNLSLVLFDAASSRRHQKDTILLKMILNVFVTVTVIA